jgi:hypothetical protein
VPSTSAACTSALRSARSMSVAVDCVPGAFFAAAALAAPGGVAAATRGSSQAGLARCVARRRVAPRRPRRSFCRRRGRGVNLTPRGPRPGWRCRFSSPSPPAASGLQRGLRLRRRRHRSRSRSATRRGTAAPRTRTQDAGPGGRRPRPAVRRARCSRRVGAQRAPGNGRRRQRREVEGVAS